LARMLSKAIRKISIGIEFGIVIFSP